MSLLALLLTRRSHIAHVKPLTSLLSFQTSPTPRLYSNASPEHDEKPKSTSDSKENTNDGKSPSDTDTAPASNYNLEDPYQKAQLARHASLLQQLRSSTTVLHQELTDTTPAWKLWLVNKVADQFQSWIGKSVQEKIEKDFDIQEAQEGALDAFWTFHKLLSEDDYDGLKGMVSAKVLSALEATKNEYAASGLVWRTEINPDSLEAQIRGLNFWSKHEIARYDEEEAGVAAGEKADVEVPKLTNMPAGMWMILTVQFKAKQKITISRKDDSHIVAELDDSRPQKWKFARGPLPDTLPARQLESPWWLLSI